MYVRMLKRFLPLVVAATGATAHAQGYPQKLIRRILPAFAIGDVYLPSLL